jgi:hypothetical protein
MMIFNSRKDSKLAIMTGAEIRHLGDGYDKET